MKQIKLLIGSALAFFSINGWTQNTELVVPYGAGGASDLVARAMAPHMSTQLNRNIVVINRPGGNTKIGNNHVLNRPADGSTMMLMSSWIFLNPAQYRDAGFKISDYDMITPFGHSPIVVAVRSDSAIQNWNDLISQAKNKNLNCGVHGEAPKFISQLLAKKLALPNLQMVNFKAYADHMTALLSGTVECGMATKQEFMNMHKENKIRIIAVSSQQPLADLPAAKLLKDIDSRLAISAIYSLGLLSTTPSLEKNRILEAARNTAADPDFQKSLQNMGINLNTEPVTVRGQSWAVKQYESVDAFRAASGIDRID
jgi:tripartite-type tricarboxylate transporter receptor subunit TctC